MRRDCLNYECRFVNVSGICPNDFALCSLRYGFSCRFYPCAGNPCRSCVHFTHSRNGRCPNASTDHVRVL